MRWGWPPWKRTRREQPAEPPQVQPPSDSSLTIGEVISQVKEAVRRANVVGRDGTSIAISKLDLTLQVVKDLSGGISGNWTVPVVGVGVGVQAKIDRAATSTIKLQLVPPSPVQGSVQALGTKVNVADDLVDAIEVIKAGVLAGATDEPRFDMATGSVELSFVVTVRGGISIIALAERSEATSHGLTLTLIPHRSGGASG